MTESKVIKKLKQHFEYLKHAWKPHPDYETMDAIGYAIQALEKQIPKRPIKSKEQRIRYVNTYYCPTCNLGFTGFNIAKWCYHCGQKLDWSDDE
jgi:hypothetical protein